MYIAVAVGQSSRGCGDEVLRKDVVRSSCVQQMNGSIVNIAASQCMTMDMYLARFHKSRGYLLNMSRLYSYHSHIGDHKHQLLLFPRRDLATCDA